MKELGSIWAYIDGDYRYGQNLRVFLDTRDPQQVIVEIRETGASGGMDGPGGTTPETLTLRQNTSTIKGSAVARLIKDAIANRGDTIKRYGKVTKNFNWHHDSSLKGISAKACQQALDSVKG